MHALAKREMFDGFVAAFLRGTGQIPLDRYAADPAAIRAGLRVVRDGGVLGIIPEGTRGNGDLRRFHHGAAHLALVTGASVVPVTLLGTRAGDGSKAVPTRGGDIDIVLGRPWQTTQQASPAPGNT